MTTIDQNDNYWYRQPWIWFVIALLAATMLASFMMLFVAMMNAPELVVTDYSNIDKQTNKTRAQDRMAVELNLTAVVYVEAANVRIELSSAEGLTLPDTLIVRARNSTLAKLDSAAELTGSNGAYTGTLPLPDNAYDLQVEDPLGNWRLSKRMFGRPAKTTLSAFMPGQ